MKSEEQIKARIEKINNLFEDREGIWRRSYNPNRRSHRKIVAEFSEPFKKEKEILEWVLKDEGSEDGG